MDGRVSPAMTKGDRRREKVLDCFVALLLAMTEDAFPGRGAARQRCTADPGAIIRAQVPALRGGIPDDASHRREHAATRPGHEVHDA